MNAQEFDQLENRQKADLLWEWGYFLCSRRTGPQTFALFLINDFFAEVAFSAMSNLAEKIRVISPDEVLSAYPDAPELNHPVFKAALARTRRSQRA